MFNVGAGELVVILVVALLVLGPSRLPELARGLGKFLREFRRQTDDVRTAVEREFYRMDLSLEDRPARPGALPTGASPTANAPPGPVVPLAEPLGVSAPPAAAASDAPHTAPAEAAVEPALVPASPIANESFRAIPRGAAAAAQRSLGAPEPEPTQDLGPATPAAKP